MSWRVGQKVYVGCYNIARGTHYKLCTVSKVGRRWLAVGPYQFDMQDKNLRVKGPTYGVAPFLVTEDQYKREMAKRKAIVQSTALTAELTGNSVDTATLEMVTEKIAEVRAILAEKE